MPTPDHSPQVEEEVALRNAVFRHVAKRRRFYDSMRLEHGRDWYIYVATDLLAQLSADPPEHAIPIDNLAALQAARADERLARAMTGEPLSEAERHAASEERRGLIIAEMPFILHPTFTLPWFGDSPHERSVGVKCSALEGGRFWTAIIEWDGPPTMNFTLVAVNEGLDSVCHIEVTGPHREAAAAGLLYSLWDMWFDSSDMATPIMFRELLTATPRRLTGNAFARWRTEQVDVRLHDASRIWSLAEEFVSAGEHAGDDVPAAGGSPAASESSSCGAPPSPGC